MEPNDAKDMMQMMSRIRRLQKLTQSNTAQTEQAPVVVDGAEKTERILLSAIPFLDVSYRKELYTAVHLMQIRRVLSGDVLEAREKEEIPPALRRRQMLAAIRPHLSKEEQGQMDQLIQIMDAKYMMEVEKHGFMEQTRNTGTGQRTHCTASGGNGKKQR